MIELHAVTKRYEIDHNRITALEKMDLAIETGEFVVVLGPSGCGKTTLLNVIGALDTPTEGTVRVGDHEISSMNNAELFAYRRSTVSFVFQSFNLFPALTALENVQFGAEVGGRKRWKRSGGGKSGEERAREALEQVSLGDRLRHFPHELSGGEQQRVAIARALATETPVLLADEPTGELDYRTGVSILELLLAQAAAGTTVLTVTHNAEIARIADRVLSLSNGRIVTDGPPTTGRLPVTELRW